MRMFTVRYVTRGRVTTVTVQGDEITTRDDLFCISDEGLPVVTFPKEDVLHVTSHGSDDRPAPTNEEELDQAARRPVKPRSQWTPPALPTPRRPIVHHPPAATRPPAPAHRAPQHPAGLRASHRVVGRPRPVVS